MQEGKPLGLFSKKISDTQKNPVTEQELLAIIETIDRILTAVLF
jgi:hypothetical protein